MSEPQQKAPIPIKVIAAREDEHPDIADIVTRMEEEADQEVSAGTVTLRWGREQIDVVKRAAALLGVPYQTYLKQVVFRQALEDIERATAVLHSGPQRRP